MLVLWLFIGTSGLCLALIYGTYAALPDWPSRASFGDMAGAVDAFFGALALAGVVYALILQQRELAIQRKELVLTRQQMIEQTKVNSARLDLEMASVLPVLRFDSFVNLVDVSLPTGNNWGDGWLVVKGRNVGGALRHAECRVWYGSGEFSELFPRDQDEDAILTSSEDPDRDPERSIDSGSVFYLRFYFRIPTAVDFGAIPLNFSADLILQYVNSFNQVRFSEYRIRLLDKGEQKIGKFILLRDLDAESAFRARLLESHPGTSRRPMPSLTIESLYGRD
jgi:hypothetical protein